jgi:hypothetical protein
LISPYNTSPVKTLDPTAAVPNHNYAPSYSEFNNISLRMRASLLIPLISVVILGLPLLATSFGIHGHARAHRRALTTKIETVTEVAIVTVTVDEGIANLVSGPSISTAINGTSIVSTPSTSTSATSTVITNFPAVRNNTTTDPS